MAYGDPNDFGWWNLVVKFLLFVTNIIVWVSRNGALHNDETESMVYTTSVFCLMYVSLS